MMPVAKEHGVIETNFPMAKNSLSYLFQPSRSAERGDSSYKQLAVLVFLKSYLQSRSDAQDSPNLTELDRALTELDRASTEP